MGSNLVPFSHKSQEALLSILNCIPTKQVCSIDGGTKLKLWLHGCPSSYQLEAIDPRIGCPVSLDNELDNQSTA